MMGLFLRERFRFSFSGMGSSRRRRRPLWPTFCSRSARRQRLGMWLLPLRRCLVGGVLFRFQEADENYSIGKILKKSQIPDLSRRAGAKHGGVALVLTAEDVAVEGFCMSNCGFHGSDNKTASPFIWVGNSVSQCPGQCAWPFHRPIYGPQTPPLLPPNADVGLDGMILNVAALLAGTATNPFGNGYFLGSPETPLEEATACTGVYGRGAYPGYAGEVRRDEVTGASYNAAGVGNRKYLLPALFDPDTSRCSTLV